MASTVLPNGIIIPEKYSRDWYADLYHNWQELDNLLGGGTPKDGTLTIQKNSSTVGTFSANQATNETIDITVPTATSELTNDSNFVQSSDLATVATSGSYTDLSDKPTIPTVNNATLTIQQNGTAVDTFTANSSSDKTANIQCVDLTNNQTVAGNKEFTGTTTAHDVIPSATDTYNLGSPSYQWNNAYIKSLTINGVACGDILTHNASEFVNVTGAQTIAGEKTFSNLRTYFGRDISCYSVRKYGKNLNPTTNTYQYLNFGGNLASEGPTNDWSSGYLEQVVGTNGASRGRWFVQDTSENPVGLELWASGNDKQVRPFQNGNTDLGTSTKKWKSFNGVNPGALSLPSGTVGMNLIGDVSVVGTEKKLSKDITVTGYIYVDVSFTSSNRLNLYNDTKKYGIWIPCDSDRIRQIMPISAGDRLEFNVLDAGSTVNTIQLFPCQGNV